MSADTFSTSKEAYDWCKANGYLSETLEQVVAALSESATPMNQTMVHQAVVRRTGKHSIEKYSLSPRFAVLARMDIIEEAGKNPCPVTGHTTVFYRLTLRKPRMSIKDATNTAKSRASRSALERELKEARVEIAQLKELLNIRTARNTSAQQKIKETPVQTSFL